MKKILLLVTLLLATSSLGWAGACTMDTLANYIAMGATGCTVGTLEFSNFSYITTGSGGGGTAPSAGGIVVTPITPTALVAGFDFVGGFVAGSGETADGVIHYTVTSLGPLIEDWTVQILAGAATSTGIGSVAEAASNGATLLAFVSGHGNQMSQTATFAPIGSLNISKDISANGGTASDGAAHVSEFTNTFSTVIPEPASMLLFGSGLLVLGGYVRRRPRKA